MDANSFLDAGQRARRPGAPDWLWAIFETALGATLLWIVARGVSLERPLIRGWIGMVGLILVLHFGTFQIVTLFWQAVGVKATPIMFKPLRSTSLSEFWGRRWNLGFRQLAHELIFRPLQRRVGLEVAGMAVFVASGLIHDLVISLPARGGYGLSTLYFTVQGCGVMLERSNVGRGLKLMNGRRGWCFTMMFLVVPRFWLFHPYFVMRVILPFMRVIHAL